jgi:hypothetical protein
MFQNHNKRWSKTLLDYQKIVVKQLIDSQCVLFCVSSKSKRLPATYIVCHFYTLPNVKHSSTSFEPLVDR